MYVSISRLHCSSRLSRVLHRVHTLHRSMYDSASRWWYVVRRWLRPAPRKKKIRRKNVQNRYLLKAFHSEPLVLYTSSLYYLGSTLATPKARYWPSYHMYMHLCKLFVPKSPKLLNHLQIPKSNHTPHFKK